MKKIYKLLIKIRRRIITVLIGKELLQNITSINKINEEIVKLKNVVTSDMTKINETVSQIEKDMNKKTDDLNRKSDDLNLKADDLNKKTDDLNRKADALNKKTDDLNKKADGLNRKIQTVLNTQLFRDVIENCEWVKDKTFAPGGWDMDNAALYTLFHILNSAKPKNILEFGLGQSSKLLYQYTIFSENAKALTVEHDNNWIDSFFNGLPENIKPNVKQLDKEIIIYNSIETLSYKNINKIIGEEKYDLIIIDGPFGSAHYSRSQIIAIVKNNLCSHFCIFMDDSERIGEKETIDEICKVLEEKKIEYLINNYIGDTIEKKHHTIICSIEWNRHNILFYRQRINHV
ncbi:MAG: hypothetical protein FWH35_00320 [Treponema sp.]|nr:hypothetical protein [Treponema sp.]